MRGALVLALCLLAGPAFAEEPPRLSLPLDCAIGIDCAILQYADLAPGPGALDRACGPLSYDGHGGTDFYLLRLDLLQAGVPVLAAAAGEVRAVRDGMADRSVLLGGREEISGRRAGNSVVLDHGGGWETQYAHLRQGSVAVAPGERVAAGQRLGLIGLSGDSGLPHLHFTLRSNGTTFDPFTGEPLDAGCQVEGKGLWSAEAAAALPYLETGPWDAGFATEAADNLKAQTGGYARTRLAAHSPALVFWAYAWGVQEGDRERIRLLGPDGGVLAEAEEEIDRGRLLQQRFVGRKRPDGGWPAGIFRGEYSLLRDGRTLFTTLREIRRD
ncbi:MAG: M23 family metallopeptidase [Rhodovibrionaceae bacterium]